MKITITEMLPEDVEAIWEIEKRSFSHPCSLDDIMSATQDESTHKIYKATDENGTICGFASLMTAFDEAELYDIAVDEQYRRSGIGKSLLDFVTDKAKQANSCAVYLEVRESNTAAITLYMKHGFEKTGIRRNYYKNPTENAITMKKVFLEYQKEIT